MAGPVKKKLNPIGVTAAAVGAIIILSVINQKFARGPSPLDKARAQSESVSAASRVSTSLDQAANTPPKRYVYEQYVKQYLKDPDSAQFGDETFVKSKAGVWTLCGKVNAKNSYGGYTGMLNFIAMGPIVATDTPIGDNKFRKSWNKICAGKSGAVSD